MGAVFDKKQIQKREFVFVVQKTGGVFCKQTLKFVNITKHMSEEEIAAFLEKNPMLDFSKPLMDRFWLDYHMRMAERRSEEEETRKKVRRRVIARARYKDGSWATFLNNPEIQDPASREGKLFRRRFRVPYEIFGSIMQWASDAFPTSSKDVADRDVFPLQLKGLGVLNLLGCFSGIGCSEETVRLWSIAVESVRKDIECTFGILKKRFRFLVNP